MKKITPYVIATITFISLNILVLSTIIYKQNLQSSHFRLHITANSNHKDDQIIKIKLLEYLKNTSLKNINSLSKKDLIKYFEDNHDEILSDINNFLRSNNFDYTAKLKLGKCYYDKKESKEYSMPSGIYESANIVLGTGYGKNFWTILYSDDETITDSLMPLSNEYDENTTYSFYTIEVLNKIAAGF